MIVITVKLSDKFQSETDVTEDVNVGRDVCGSFAAIGSSVSILR